MARFILPVDGKRTQNFGDNTDYYKKFGQLGHNGWDIAVPVNTPVRASADGTIYFEGWGQNSSWMGSIAGICVIINHGDSFTATAHMNSTIVNKGQKVVQGQIIGCSGATGTVTGPHVHFETFPGSPNWKNGYAGRVNPSNYLTPQGGNNVAEKLSTDGWRQLSHGILGANGLAGRKTSLDGSRDGEGHVGRDLTNAYLQELFLSAEGRQWRDSQDPNSINGINARLATPVVKEIVVEKPVQVIKEVIKEVPIEKVIYQEKIVEVVKGDDERSLGDLLSAAFKKLFKIK